MTTVTERLVVLVTPEQKNAVTQRAKAQGLAVGDYIRRQVLDSDDVLGALMQELAASTERARAKLDSTLARIEQADQQRQQVERQARQDALAAFQAELDPDRFAQLLVT